MISNDQFIFGPSKSYNDNITITPPRILHKERHVIHWFRRGLRLHDNPALFEGLKSAVTFRCIFIIDPWFADSSNVGINKWRLGPKFEENQLKTLRCSWPSDKCFAQTVPRMGSVSMERLRQVYHQLYKYRDPKINKKESELASDMIKSTLVMHKDYVANSPINIIDSRVYSRKNNYKELLDSDEYPTNQMKDANNEHHQHNHFMENA